jgi:hypothetical protein
MGIAESSPIYNGAPSCSTTCVLHALRQDDNLAKTRRERRSYVNYLIDEPSRVTTSYHATAWARRNSTIRTAQALSPA